MSYKNNVEDHNVEDQIINEREYIDRCVEALYQLMGFNSNVGTNDDLLVEAKHKLKNLKQLLKNERNYNRKIELSKEIEEQNKEIKSLRKAKKKHNLTHQN